MREYSGCGRKLREAGSKERFRVQNTTEPTGSAKTKQSHQRRRVQNETISISAMTRLTSSSYNCNDLVSQELAMDWRS